MKLGKGCFASVNKCISKEGGKEYAVKITTSEKCIQEKDVVLQELAAHCSLPPHPNIVNLKEFFFCHGQLLIVMELISGGDLLHRIVKLSKYSERNASKAIRDLTLALEHCHKHGIVHRDLKLENLLLASEADDAVLKLADFGFAGRLTPDHPVLFEPCGSPGYVAPEFLESIFETNGPAKGYGRTVDMWAVGVILYLLVSGGPPFPLDMDQLMAPLTSKHQFHDAFQNVSATTKDCIDKLLCHDPAKRLTASQLLAHPFIHNADSLSDTHLEAIHAELKKFNAKRLFRKAVLASVAMNKFKNTINSLKLNKQK